MNEKQKTAVQWLENQLKTRPKPLDNSQIDKLFEQALAMEREQIEDAWTDGWLNRINVNRSQEFFNDTYQSEP